MIKTKFLISGLLGILIALILGIVWVYQPLIALAQDSVMVEETSDGLSIQIDTTVISDEAHLLKNDEDKLIISYLGPENIPDFQCNELSWNRLKARALEIEASIDKSAGDQVTKASLNIPITQKLTNDYVYCINLPIQIGDQLQNNPQAYKIQNSFEPQIDSEADLRFYFTTPLGVNSLIPSQVHVVANSEEVSATNFQYATVVANEDCGNLESEELTFNTMPVLDSGRAYLPLSESMTGLRLCFIASIGDSGQLSEVYQVPQTEATQGDGGATDNGDSANWWLVGLIVIAIGITIYLLTRFQKAK
ncbi:MAG: hypothetical protein OXF30_00425 [Candidatus Saccharibacteria bacterium]|nr:hypothetical protein [Candidatus Saccharibacteria bacterium]